MNQVAIDSYNQSFEVWSKNKGSGHSLLEKPAIYSLLPVIQGKSVLCVGCGLGEECNYIQSLGAERVVGIDVAEAMLQKAKESYPEIEFLQMDMQKLGFQDGSFDLVFSSLAMHYCSDWKIPLKEMNRVLRDDGIVIFSTHHPAAWGAEKEETDSFKKQLLGYTLSKDTGELQIFGDYFTSRKIEGNFFGKFDVVYHHKSFSAILREIRESSFDIIDCIEPEPIPSAKEIDPSFWDIRSKIPLFVIFKLQKKLTSAL